MSHSLCPICGETAHEIVERAESPYRVVKCSGCDVAYVDPLPGAQELARHYDPDYYAEWISTQKKKRERMWSRRLNAIQDRVGSGDLLDVGCGDGLFLELAQANGWRVQATDVSAYATRLAARRLGRKVFCGEIWEAGFDAHSFDVVTLWHVLEHTTQPGRVLREVRRVLKTGGILVVAVPNFNNRVMQLAYRLVKGRRLRRFSIHDKEIHLFHFSVTSLRRLLDAAGFECRRIGPDFGIVELPHRLINGMAVALQYMLGVNWYNSIQALAVPKLSERPHR